MTPPQVAPTCDELAVIRRLQRLGAADPPRRTLSRDARARLREALVAEAETVGLADVVHLRRRHDSPYARSASA